MLPFSEGACSFGARCRFLHDSTHMLNTEEMTDAGNSRHDEDNEASKQYHGWRRLMKYQASGYFKAPDETGQLWNDALELLDSDDRNIHQLVARDLANDEFRGFGLILETTKLGAQPIQSLAVAISFLWMITHPSLLDCLSVDTFIGTVFSFFSGANGAGLSSSSLTFAVSLVSTRRHPSSTGHHQPPQLVKRCY